MDSHILNSLHLERIYLDGARDLLMRLKDDFDMSLVPSVRYDRIRTPESKDYEASHIYAPLCDKKKRLMIGRAFTDLMLRDREALLRFLTCDYDGISVRRVKKDKNGNVTGLEVDIVR